MIYNTFQDLKLSALGMGCMRLPVVDGNDAVIDEAAAEKMLDLCMARGVNYYDTAWGYHSGNSERVVGKALQKYPRDRFYLASKFPGYDLGNMGKVEEIFEEQLARCRVDTFDFYLFHNVCEMNIDAYLDPKYGTYDYLMAQKRSGRIRHLGFSAHGDIPTMRRFLEAYGRDMEFCQIELNYFDWRFQNAQGKLELLREWGIPVWVMEPVRGGQLARLEPADEARLRAARPEEGAPAWAFRFLQSLQGVTVTLSGMSNLQQLQENLATFAERKPLSAQEMELILSVADDMIRRTTVPCTACHYCVSHCPQQLPIPDLLHLYNEAMAAGSGAFISSMGLSALPAEQQPSACIGCHSCEQVCPQQIHIPDALADFARRMGQ